MISSVLLLAVEDLPDLHDPEVADATKKIQAGFRNHLRKKEAAKAKVLIYIYTIKSKKYIYFTRKRIEVHKIKFQIGKIKIVTHFS